MKSHQSKKKTFYFKHIRISSSKTTFNIQKHSTYWTHTSTWIHFLTKPKNSYCFLQSIILATQIGLCWWKHIISIIKSALHRTELPFPRNPIMPEQIKKWTCSIKYTTYETEIENEQNSDICIVDPEKDYKQTNLPRISFIATGATFISPYFFFFGRSIHFSGRIP